MKDAFIVYLLSMGQNVPSYVCEGLLSVFFIVSVGIFAIHGIRKGWRIVAFVLLLEYVFFIFCSTVIFREYNENLGHMFIPFWSYVEIYKGYYSTQLPEKVMNLVVFMPVGCLLSVTSRSMKWWIVLLIGFFISISIEMLQFFLKRGSAEFDDVFHNSIGCLIGYGLCLVVMQLKVHWYTPPSMRGGNKNDNG